VKGILKTGNRSIVLREMDLFTFRPHPHLDIVGRYDENVSDLSLIFSISARKALILDKELKETTGVKLLFDPYGVECFTPLDFKPFQAGIWEVRECHGS
jgi:hypothetical protein